MKNMLKIGLAGFVAVALGLLALAAEQQGKGGNDYTKSVTRPYEEVLAAVKAAAQTQGFRVSNVHDIAASLRKEGIEREPYATVEVCNSKIAAQVLKAEPLLGSIMPCRIAVFQQGKETVVSMIRPTRLMTLFPLKAEVEHDAAQVERSMEAIINEATR
jgi:uncharacterized protein (DUF302 family)